MTTPNEVIQQRRMSGLLADMPVPDEHKPFAFRGDQPWTTFWPIGAAREFDLGRGRRIIGVRTSTRAVMLQGRSTSPDSLEGLPSRPCRATS